MKGESYVASITHTPNNILHQYSTTTEMLLDNPTYSPDSKQGPSVQYSFLGPQDVLPVPTPLQQASSAYEVIDHVERGGDNPTVGKVDENGYEIPIEKRATTKSITA